MLSVVLFCLYFCFYCWLAAPDKTSPAAAANPEIVSTPVLPQEPFAARVTTRSTPETPSPAVSRPAAASRELATVG